MTPTLALQFLSLFLLFLMNGHVIGARDMKYKATSVSNDESYGEGYITSESAKPNYVATYSATKHNHNHGKLHQVYIAGYRSSTHDSDTPYIAGYITTRSAKKDPKESSHDHDHDHTTKPYIAQYGGDTGPKEYPKESSHDHDHTTTTEPYVTQYGEIGAPIKESSNVDHTEAFKTGFFGLDDLYVGNVMTLQFPIQEVSHYLPRKEAESIPFSISQLPSVLQLLSISEDSSEANAMRDTLRQCEAEPITGETKLCATSLESMLEFVGTIMGSETKHNILTTTTTTSGGVPLKKLKILEVSEDMNAPEWVACHPLPYPYAVYYCHFIATGSKVFKVSLGSENGDGDKIEALGICHLDTSDWNPNHIIFRQLGIKPGKDAVCHFFPIKHLMWLPQPLQPTM